MKRLVSGPIAHVLTAFLLGGCISGCSAFLTSRPVPADEPTVQEQSSTVTIKLFNYKIEIAEQLIALKEDYETDHPGVKLDIETAFDGYDAELKAKFAAAEMPDIFTIEGISGLRLWGSELEDLSDQPWADSLIDIAVPGISMEGRVYGLPMALEGYGYVYNKALFRQAGIDEVPRTFSQLQEAVGKLESHGITPFVHQLSTWFASGAHQANNAFAKQDNPDSFIQALNNGTATFADNRLFQDWSHLIRFELDHTLGNPLTLDYNTQLAEFASGHAAILTLGNWADDVLMEMNPDLQIGLMPQPINDDAQLNDRIFVGVSRYLVINRHSRVKAETEEFLNWLVSSEQGQRYLTEEFHFIPALTQIPQNSVSLGPIGSEVLRYVSEGKTLEWQWMKFPESMSEQFSAAIQQLAAGKITDSMLLEQFQYDWDRNKEKY